MTETGALLIGLLLLVWLWFETMRIRGIAIRQCRQACNNHGVQFLDDTIALDRMALKRDTAGKLRVHRVFLFEYSADGLHRQTGHLTMSGDQAEILYINHD